MLCPACRRPTAHERPEPELTVGRPPARPAAAGAAAAAATAAAGGRAGCRPVCGWRASGWWAGSIRCQGCRCCRCRGSFGGCQQQRQRRPWRRAQWQRRYGVTAHCRMLQCLDPARACALSCREQPCKPNHLAFGCSFVTVAEGRGAVLSDGSAAGPVRNANDLVPVPDHEPTCVQHEALPLRTTECVLLRRTPLSLSGSAMGQSGYHSCT